MKKIILMVLLVLGLIACDNNEGPFETRKENGLSVLYSNGKLAKGWVEQTNYDFNTDATVKISEIEYDEGMPTGNFKFYDYNGVLYLKAETKEENGVYKGKIIIGHDQNEVLEGEFSINPNWIVDGKVKVDNKSGIMLRGSEIFMATCINGTISSPQLKATKKDGKYDGAYESYFGNGQLYEKCTYKDGKYDREYKKYFPNGQLLEKSTYKDGKYNGEYEEYHSNGRLYLKCTYKDGKYDGEYKEYLSNGQLYEKCTYKDGKYDRE